MKETLIKGIAATAAAVTTSVFGFSNAASAFMFGTDGIRYEENTTIEFTFKQNGGGYDSILSVYEVLDNGRTAFRQELLGEELNSTGSFEFLANKTYTLGLTNYHPKSGASLGTVYSTTRLNWAYKNGGVGYQQALFGAQPGLEAEGQTFANPGDYTGGVDPTQKTVKISFNDGGQVFGSDADYNDFVVYAAPEPVSMGGMALGAAGLAVARRRRRNKSA
ncbi:MAG: PEP-CTERM sorting domain-containing protein [Oscillatoria sp. SIO1A7]|nr:PEP-CTERM sorting domain-containing protein [Oscillatoria sp. SIO1A7]